MLPGVEGASVNLGTQTAEVRFAVPATRAALAGALAAAGYPAQLSQITLAADTTRGNRPSFTAAAAPELGRSLFDELLRLARARHPRVQAGVFGADMQVHLVNDGPVTIPMRLS